MNALIEGLIAEGNTVKVLAVTSHKFQVDFTKIPREYLERTGLETIHFDLKIRPVSLIKSIITGESYHVSRFDSAEFKAKLIHVLKADNYDVVQLETLYMCPYIDVIRKNSTAKILLRAHNTEHLIWKQLALESVNVFKKFILSKLARTLERYERHTLPKVDGIAVISQDDIPFYNTFSSKTEIRLIPFGVKIPETNNIADVKEISLFHIGSMNWIPNQKGIKWFIEEVWPETHSKFSQLKVHLAGRKMPEWLLNCNSNGVVIVGEVENAAEFIDSHSIMIVPLFSGSGIRIKIIEAMLAGKTVISTATGAAGISYTDRKNILIANDKESFIAAISSCMKYPEKIAEIGQHAKQLVREEHDNNHVIRKLMNFYDELKQQN